MKTLLVLAIAVALCGCATKVVRTKEDAASLCRVSQDTYQKFTRVESTKYKIAGAYECTFELVATRDFTGKEINYGMRIETYSGRDWFFFERAVDSDGTPVILSVSDRQVGYGGSTYEYLTLVFEGEYLREHAGRGLDIKVMGQRGQMIVRVTPEVLTGFLERVKQQLGALLSD